MKQQSGSETVAFIPAFHITGDGQPSASLQIITNSDSHQVSFEEREFSASRDRLMVRLGDCVFSETGCRINLSTPDFAVSGTLRYGPLRPPRTDIMGPFRLIPLMECRHSVFSLSHRVDGTLTVNGRDMEFCGGIGYIEGDRGHSFPERYVWTQCGWEGNCVMLSAARIPFGWGSFTGCIAAVLFEGKELRIATYRGARVETVGGDTVCLRQGGLTLEAHLLENRAQILRAPVRGEMIRSIHESAACRVRYLCRRKGRTLFDFVSDCASFENNWGG